ncbi:MAG: hypothetical protein ACYDAK_06110 [Candidatus Limnocylindrales bacterium]
MTRRAASLGLAATLLATLGAAIAATPALASTSVTSAGSMSPGTTSVGTASFTLTENSVNGFPNASGTVTVTITDSASASTVHFSGTPVLSAPGSLGATVALGPAGTSFTVTTRGADNLNIEPITVSGLRISADVGAALGPIKAAMSGSLVGGIISPTTTATGILQTSVAVGSTGGVVVNVSSPCGFASTGGLNGNVTFSDIADSRALTAATALAGGQQTLTIGGGGSTHAIGTTITQTVADCLGVNLASPGTVGSGPTQHLAFIGQPGGGTAGVVWAVQPVVAVQNALNMVATGDSSTFVTLSIGTNPAGGTLSCTSGLSRTVVNGVATFFGCSISIGSPSTYTLTATSSPAWSPATSSAFLVAATQHLAFIGQPGGGTAGVVWAVQPVVAVQNALNMVATGDSSTFVTLSIATNPAGGTLSCTSGLSRTVVNGVATFFGCSISIGSPSAYTLTATSSPAWSPATSSAFFVSQSALSVVLTDSIAAGVNRGTMGFGTASVVVSRGGWITLFGTTSPNLAGSLVQVWTRTKSGAWHVLTSRLAAADGTIHYFARVNGWTAYQLKFAGDSSHSAAASHGRIATSRT